MTALQRRFKSYESVIVKRGKALVTQEGIIFGTYDQYGCADTVEEMEGAARLVVMNGIFEAMQGSCIPVIEINKGVYLVHVSGIQSMD